MTTLQISARKADRSVVDIAVAHTALAMLRWSSRHAQRRAEAPDLTREQILFHRRFELERACAPFSSGLFR
jgi:hypothetical protein